MHTECAAGSCTRLQQVHHCLQLAVFCRPRAGLLTPIYTPPSLQAPELPPGAVHRYKAAAAHPPHTLNTPAYRHTPDHPHPPQELELFKAWYAEIEASREAAEAALRAQEEDDALVGPSLPGAAKPGGGAGGNFGGFLLPGEGDRCGARRRSCDYMLVPGLRRTAAAFAGSCLPLALAAAFSPPGAAADPPPPHTHTAPPQDGAVRRERQAHPASW